MFERVCIVGVGLLGGSLARDLRSHGLAKHVVGVTRSDSSARLCQELGVVDSVQPLASAVTNAELVVVATPMQTMLPVLKELAKHVHPDAIITDVGSVKMDLYKCIKRDLRDLLPQCVLAHPIAGGENSGVVASRENLFESKHVIMTSCPEQNGAKVEKVTAMWRSVGAKTLTMSLEQHDAIFAKTSHLPHVVAFSLVNYLNQQPNRDELFELAASGFYDFTRIASSDAEMWRDICMTNHDQILTALQGYIDQLTQIKNEIAAQDQDAVFQYFEQAKSSRDSGLNAKLAQLDSTAS